jgi:hypothetical protein
LAVIAFLVVFGLVFAYFSEIRAGKVGSYFLLPYRAHELIIGVLTMFMLTQFPLKNRRQSALRTRSLTVCAFQEARLDRRGSELQYTLQLCQRNSGLDERGATKLEYPGTIVIDPKVVMCVAVECTTSIGNIALYKDANHINMKAAVVIAERYLSVRGNPFAS